jgi:TonB family protein
MGNEPISKVSPPPSWRTILSALLLPVLLILPLAPRVLGGPSKDADVRAQATALFTKALAVSDLRARGSPPFEMRATINVEQSHHEPSVVGTYLLKWVSPEKWREEIAFPNYVHIRVGGKNQYWQSRTTQYEILPVLQLYQGLDFLKDLHVWSNPAAIAALKDIKLSQKKAHGTKLDCATLFDKGKNYRPDYCFDPTSGMLVSEFGGSNEFSNFISFNGKSFPGSIRIKESLAPTVTLQVNSISHLAATEGGDFQPPQNSTAWPSCEDPDALPEVMSQVMPVYPMEEKMARHEGAVSVYAVIGIDGRVHNLKVLSAPDSALAQSALTALGQWEYTTETCGGTPVPVETLLYIIYRLH